MTQAHIALETQGSFTLGGTTITHEGEFPMKHFLAPEGQKAYGDHVYVFYQIPVHAKKYPNFRQPRRGEAGLSTKPVGKRNLYANNPMYADGVTYVISCRCL